MGRGVRADLLRADIEMGRFVRMMTSEYERLGLPKISPYARMQGRGGHITLTPDDPTTELVSRWYATLEPYRKAVIFNRYLTGDQKYLRQYGVHWTASRMYVEYDRLLSELAGVLKLAEVFFPEKKPATMSA